MNRESILTKGKKEKEKKKTTPSQSTALMIDWNMYEKYLEGSELSEVKKRELLETLWSIITSFVDLGFDVHPVQQVCGKDAKKDGLPPPDSKAVIELTTINQEE